MLSGCILTFYVIFFQDTIKQLQEELKTIEEAEKLCMSFTDWLNLTQKSFTVLTDCSEPLDRVSMDKKMKKLEVLIYLPKFSLYFLACVCALNFTVTVLSLHFSLRHLDIRCNVPLTTSPWMGCNKSAQMLGITMGNWWVSKTSVFLSTHSSKSNIQASKNVLLQSSPLPSNIRYLLVKSSVQISLAATICMVSKICMN